jgi:hypothetical protein
VCVRGGPQSAGAGRAPAEQRRRGGDPGLAGPRPGHVHRHSDIHGTNWLRTQGPR